MMNSIVNGLATVFCDYGNQLILLVAGINFCIWIYIKKLIKGAQSKINPPSNKRYKVKPDMEWDNKQVAQLSDIRTKLVRLYAWYTNITAIFPLLGILGTVAALVTYSSETMMDNFMIALSTTLFGVFAAIIYKGLDASISGSLDILVEDADYIIQNFDAQMRKGNET